MGKHKKIISIALTFVLFFTGLPYPNFSSGGIPYAYAAESTPAVDIAYDGFTNTENLQLNGDSLIENNAIRFESGGGTGESVFTADKVVLGGNLSFSTAFSFRNISPSTPVNGTKGGFTFTLQSVGNSAAANDFQDESVNPSLSIAFTADYSETGTTARLFEQAGNVHLASLTGILPAVGPMIRCELSAVPYIDGVYNNPIFQRLIDTYNMVDETSDFYHVWMGYDGEEGFLHVLCLDPSGRYTYNSDYVNLADAMPTNEVYAGFMGSLGNAGNTSEINSWHFKNDLSILHEAIAEADEAWLTSEMEMVEANPVEDFYLPLVGQYGSTIRWVSSNTDVVAEDGTVNPPSAEEGNQIVTLTATITKGSEVRGTRSFMVTIKVRDADIVAADHAWLTNSVIMNENNALDNIVSDLNLPAVGQYGSTISWFSTDTAVAVRNGMVTRPAYLDGDRKVTLTAYIYMNCVTLEKTFNITVKALGISDAEIVDADQLWLTEERILNGNSALDKVTKNLMLPPSGQYGSSIVWKSSNEGVAAADGTVTRPSLARGDQTVTLTATIRSGESVREKVFTITVKVSDVDIVFADDAWLTDILILNGNKGLNNVVANLNLPASGNNGSTISWTTSNKSVVSANGKVTRPPLGSGNAEVILTATISSGDATPLTSSFTVMVRAIGLSDTEMAYADKLWLTEDRIKNANSALSMVTSDLNLPTRGGSHGSAISWKSGNTGIVDISGAVTRPSFIEGDRTVILTATISMGDATPESKTFTVTVRALEQTAEEKMNADKEWLEASVILNENNALDNVTGNLFLPTMGNSGSTISWASTDTAVMDTNGKVTRPAFSQGDKTVTLTAAIGIGAAPPLTKAFTIVVKALAQTDEEKDADIVNADYEWLVDTVILNGNSALNNVTGYLHLPAIGEMGSKISWTSGNMAFIDVDGTVTRPTYAQGSKIVTLTAAIRMGSFTKEKTFHITVKANPITNEELVAMDYAWLTEARILNGNSSLNNITQNLYLPTNGMYGAAGSHISWASSHHGFVTVGGNVYRPMFHLGDQTISLTATISKDSASLKKTFTVVVKCLDLTDNEAVNEDSRWLKRYNILGANLSANSVTQNLSWPLSGPYDSIITWRSDKPDIISHDGVVARPKNKTGNRRVNVTATVTKGGEQVIVPFQYIVLEEPDRSAPAVTGTTPGNNSTGVLWDTNKITVTYNENIVLAQSPGIALRASQAVQIATNAEGNKLIITPFSALSAGENRLLIPAGAVTDAAGNPAEAYELKFTVEEKLVKNIEVISSSPYDTEKDVDLHIPEISFRFNSSDIVKGRNFDVQIGLRTIGKVIPVTLSLSGDTVTMRLRESLAPATVYDIVIYEGVVQDRFLNKNSTKIIQFKTKGTSTPVVKIPKITSVYPADGQTGVSVNPNIEVVFSDVQKFKSYQLKLTDALGNEYPLYAPYTLELFETKLIFKPRVSLKPNMVYTLSGPYGSAVNPSLKEFSTQFTTGSGPRVIKTSPATGDWNAPTRGIVEIHFNTPVTKGANFKDIAFEDYLGNPVEFVGEEAGSKAVLRSVSELELYMSYTIYIPCGAYKNSAGDANDQNKITFYTTEERLPTKLEPKHLDVSDMGFVGKAFKISIDTIEMTSWGNYVRALGYGPISYEWHIDGKSASTKGLFYYTFYSPGEHEITLTAKDKYGFSYSVKKTVEICALQDVRMTLKDSGKIMKINTSETGTQPALNFELRLEQDDHFIYGEKIGVKLYKDGVFQRLTDYGDGGINITSKYKDNAYIYTYTPVYGDSGTYELVFTYNGFNGEQIIRQPFIITSKKPAVRDVFRFRMYEDQRAQYYEELNYVYVILNGERLKANKEMYTFNGSTFPVYTLRKTLQTNTYYDLKVENWWWKEGNRPFYLGKDTDNPAILSGGRRSAKTGMKIKSVTINHSESELKELKGIYFEGMSTKLVFNVEGDWAGTDMGYYEIATLRIGEGVSRYEDTGFKSILVQAHDNKSGIQKIIVRPGIQLKDKSEQFWIRMVSSQGYKSAWEICPDVSLLPVPSILGKKLNISVKDGEYAVNWPTVFDGPIGGTISCLQGIPVVDGGNFGLGGSMPNFEGELQNIYNIWLTFDAKGGYGQSSKTIQKTKYKKVKKVTIVGYEFEMKLEGGVNLCYQYETNEWSTRSIYIIIDGNGTKSWDKGFEILGIGFTAGVSIGGGVYGVLQIKNGDETSYSGIVRISPRAGLHVDGDFKAASVKGSMVAIIPAEIHFPTGYIGADITVDASITAKALLWSKTLYEKELYKVHWDNGKQKVNLLALQKPVEENGSGKDSGIRLMARDYLSRQSNWLGGKAASLDMQDPYRSGSFSCMGAEAEANPRIADMMENIFPEAEIALAVNDGQQWLAWTDDNPSRDAVNRTQLRLALFKDGVWSIPEWIYDDGTADFDPSVAAAGNGVLMAWHNIGKVLSEEEDLGEMLKSSEISVTESIYTVDGSKPGIINLTDDDKLDHSPKLAADGDKALLVWTKSEDLGFDLDTGENSSSPPGDQLFFSAWSNGIWTTPGAIEMDFSTVLDSSLTMKGEEALLLYVLDMDNNFSTGEDREVFARLYDGNVWGDAIRLTGNGVNDSAPKAVYADGKWFITWLEEGKISYKTGLDGETRTEECLGNIQSDYRIIVKEGERPLAALVYTQPGEDKALGIYASFYDFNNGKWSDKTGLVTGNIYTNAISASFAGDGKLNAAFTQADIITEARPQIIDGIEEFVEVRSISDKVDLKLLTYTPVHDVALLEEDGMFLSTEFPLQGTVTTVYVTLRNEGDFAENAMVCLYDGNPEEGGVKIAETAPQLIPARFSREMEIEWLVGPEEKNEYDLYAVVQPNGEVQEISTDNNTVSIKVLTSDIAITDVTCENPAACDYLINITIANRGSKVLDGAKVWLEDEAGGEVLATALLETLELGEETVLTYMIPSNGRKNMRVRVTLPDGVNEDNTDNNTRSFLLKPSSFEVKSLNIGPGDEQVNVSSGISLEFNMRVGKGAGFDQIRLMDEELNEVAISKVIENSTLIIKPQNLLAYGTGYKLTIPADALGDSYGHALERAFNISFTTITANPEIVSAYPGAGMDNAALNTVIRLKFNQNVTKGYEFSKIALYGHVDGSEANAVPVSASIEGEFLTMNYAGSLSGNTIYTLEIPRGAVENDSGETQREDYLLVFNTGEASETNEPGDPNEPGEGNNGDNHVYKANLSLGDTERTVEVRTEAGNAAIKLETLAGEIFAGSQQAVLNVSYITGVNSYTLEMPAEALASSGEALLTVNTALGSISIPSGMLPAMKEMDGKTAGITIAAGDKSRLPADVKAAIGNRPVLQLTLTLDGVVTAWNNPAVPVRVSIPYEPTAAELGSLESIVIWYIDGSGNVVTVPNGRYNAVTGTVNFTITHFSAFAVVYNRVSFMDVPDGVWYDRAVSFIAARGITLGTGNGNFSPDNRLTRGQFITMMMKACGIEPDTDQEDNFSDSGNTWYTGYLAAAKRLGISAGVGNNMFAPDKEITRQEMFTLLYNALRVIKQLPETEKSHEADQVRKLPEFIDEGQIASWAREAMTLLVETGIIRGNTGKLTPLSTATRVEMAQVLYNLMTKCFHDFGVV